MNSESVTQRRRPPRPGPAAKATARTAPGTLTPDAGAGESRSPKETPAAPGPRPGGPGHWPGLLPTALAPAPPTGSWPGAASAGEQRRGAWHGGLR